MTAPTRCPECAGLSQPGHRYGPLAGWHHVMTCSLLAHQDGQTVTDRDHFPWVASRPATDTERALLAALGFTIPVELTTVLTDPRVRVWPDLTPLEST